MDDDERGGREASFPCLLLFSQILKTLRVIPMSEQNLRMSSSWCLCDFQPKLSAKALILAFCSFVSLVLGFFLLSTSTLISPSLEKESFAGGGLRLYSITLWGSGTGAAAIFTGRWRYQTWVVSSWKRTSFRWKLRWQSQAPQMRASGVPSSPALKNSPHPSRE